MTDSTQHFSGSYRQEDVEFLLTPMALEPILDLAEKERMIQSGQRHYSEMLSPESLPSPAYLPCSRARLLPIACRWRATACAWRP